MSKSYSKTQDEIRKKFNIVPTALHLIHIKNLKSILSDGHIFSKLKMQGRTYEDISNNEVQNIRENKTIKEAGKPLHYYVPLFVSYKAPMVASLQQMNEELAYIELPLDIFERYPGTFLADGNASDHKTEFFKFDTIDTLKALDFSIIQKTVGYANDPEKSRRKSAEILVPEQIKIDEIRRICFFSETTRTEGCKILQSCGKNIATFYRADWFFTGTKLTTNRGNK